jgi:hypothetical protein
MKLTLFSVWTNIVMLCMGVIAGITAHAQEVVSTYDTKVAGPTHNWMNGPLLPLLLLCLFVLIAWGIYYFWSNGKLKDDMS